MAKLNLFLKKLIEKVSKLWDMESEPLKNTVSRWRNLSFSILNNHCVSQNLNEIRWKAVVDFLEMKRQWWHWNTHWTKNPRFIKLGFLTLLEGNLREFPDMRNVIQRLKSIHCNNQKRLWKKSQFKEAWHQCVRTFFYPSNNTVTEASVRAWLSNYVFERWEHFCT